MAEWDEEKPKYRGEKQAYARFRYRVRENEKNDMIMEPALKELKRILSKRCVDPDLQPFYIQMFTAAMRKAKSARDVTEVLANIISVLNLSPGMEQDDE